MGNTDDMETPVKALAMALELIESYQGDIADSGWTGVDLAAVGFCQGTVYQALYARLKARLTAFQAEGLT